MRHERGHTCLVGTLPGGRTTNIYIKTFCAPAMDCTESVPRRSTAMERAERLAMQYKIDKGVPFPVKGRGKQRSVYDWASMEHGDSFLIPLQGRTPELIRCRGVKDAEKYMDETGDEFFCHTSVEEDGVRFWKDKERRHARRAKHSPGVAPGQDSGRVDDGGAAGNGRVSQPIHRHVHRGEQEGLEAAN